MTTNTISQAHTAPSLIGCQKDGTIKCSGLNGSGGESKIETYRFRVEPFHVDFTGHLFMGVLGNHLLNAAEHHSHNRGWGIDQLNEEHLSWVLSRLSIELDEMPSQYDHVEVETWVESVMKLFTERNFLIRNADDGRIYGYARSIWAMIDVETRQPSNLFELRNGDILNYVVTADEKPCPIEKFGRPARLSGEPCASMMTHYADVDINSHINSIKYIEHILDVFYEQKLPAHTGKELGKAPRIRRFEIAYKAESYWGDTLTFFTEDSADSSVSAPSGCSVCGCSTTTTHVEIRKHVGATEKPAGETVVQAKIIWAD